MKLVMFCHPDFASSQSMPRFAKMLKASYESRGHQVEVWSPRAKFYQWFLGSRLAKWGGYVDQYLLFPYRVRKRLKTTSADTFFVFCDQALGPWVPLVKDRPHVVHVHDLLALRSALGEVPENPTSITGRIYQRYIRRGFQQARHFISISRKSRDDLHRYGGVNAVTSEVVYNGLNFPYAPMPQDKAQQVLRAAGLPVAEEGMLLHVSGGQWYKNQIGLIQLYSQYAVRVEKPLPLWCISPEPNARVRLAVSKVPPTGRVFFFSRLDNGTLQAAYSSARVFLLPSLAEGFGWPLVEAQACGCPVVTTDEAPMNEVAGEAARYLPRLQIDTDVAAWASGGAAVLQELLSLDPAERERLVARGHVWSKRFDTGRAIEGYLAIYHRVLDLYANRAGLEVGSREERRL
jgi:glycosyltransferase involved in cell wall biosynthesis